MASVGEHPSSSKEVRFLRLRRGQKRHGIIIIVVIIISIIIITIIIIGITTIIHATNIVNATPKAPESNRDHPKASLRIRMSGNIHGLSIHGPRH